jgi:CBS domain-containing protein
VSVVRVKDVMTREPVACRPDDTLSDAARIMWDHECGAVPVVDAHDRVIGVLTDRDVCMGGFLTGLPLHQLAVARSMSQRVISCGPEDTLDHAECLMREYRVRRLPVVGMQGRLLGMLSLTDLARVTASGRWPDRAVSSDAIEATLVAVGNKSRARH